MSRHQSGSGVKRGQILKAKAKPEAEDKSSRTRTRTNFWPLGQLVLQDSTSLQRGGGVKGSCNNVRSPVLEGQTHTAVLAMVYHIAKTAVRFRATVTREH